LIPTVLRLLEDAESVKNYRAGWPGLVPTAIAEEVLKLMA
jgi:hypothetical protein